MDGQEKTSFWGGLFRRTNLSRNAAKKLQKHPQWTDPEDAIPKRRLGPAEDLPRTRRRARSRQPQPLSHSRSHSHPEPEPEPELEQEPTSHPEVEPESGIEPEVPRARKSKGKRKVEINGHRYPSPAPLTEWPPPGISLESSMPLHQAESFVCRGAPIFKGHKRPIPHTPDSYYILYSTTAEVREEETDAADLSGSMTALMTMRMQSSEPAVYPWETLEQPSYSFYFGNLPGTITLNQWASTASVVPPAIALRDSGVMPRVMNLEAIFDRLQELRFGLEDDEPDLLYKVLYKRLLRDPDRMFNPHKTLDKQITDLILVLSRPDWIDFSDPNNQVVTRFIFGQELPKEQEDTFNERYRRFFHQVLLSLELEMRIQSRQHGEWAKEKLLRHIPPRVRWGLALARRWRQNVRVEAFGRVPDQIRLRYKPKKRQVKMLKKFATAMKWPNLAETLDNLKQKDHEFALDAISSDTFAYFSGLIVPGPTFPFLLMNTLIDMDPSPATDDLALLSHRHPACGFQYRNSYTYWSSASIVGKVLAPTCHSLAGWVGPARPTADLLPSQIARIRTRRSKQRLGAEDAESMAERSEPLGPAPEAGDYPVREYLLEKPDGDSVEMVRMEMLGLRAVATTVNPKDKEIGPRVYDATVHFAIDGESWPLRLMYDVNFISSWPCHDGPHPLFFDYVFTKIRVDEIISVKDWGNLHARERRANGTGQDLDKRRPSEDDYNSERVLVVEAFGVRDNEALARAWCAHWGLSAIVADLKKTCFACAVREAYAATLTIVILVEGHHYDDDE